MPQETNLNVSPYFDDFDRTKNYYKVLFKPGYPIQARELTTSQSILQNQVEQFGNHIFKEGSKVLGGDISFNNDLSGVVLENEYLGINVEAYLPYLVGKTIRGATTGVTARIEFYISALISEIQKPTIYVNYLTSDSQGSENGLFLDGEILEVVEDVLTTDDLPGTSETSTISIRSGQGISLTVSSNCNFVASAVYMDAGVYFARGYFIDVAKTFILLEQYSNTPNYKVGFRVVEDLVNSYEDPTLNDNAKGFSNYAAPGADRLRINLFLDKIPLDAPVDTNFIVLKEIRNGKDVTIGNTTEYNVLSKEFARRTYDESGDYYIKAPVVTPKETLNDLISNNGVFTEDQTTYNNNTPSEDLGTYSISPIRAYVQGYEVSTVSTLFLDFPKPRTTKTLEDQSVNYVTGPTYTLNRVYGSPIIGLSTDYTLSLRDSRVGTSQTSKAGKEIGLARVYDFALESGSYNSSNLNENQWDIALYDIQTYTELSLNEPITLSSPIHIKGKSSGAVGFLRYDSTNSGIITAYNTRGNFSVGEKLIFDGIENSRITTAVTNYSTNDVKSLYGIVGSAYTFTADVIQKDNFNVGTVNITAINTPTGISTVTSSGSIFIGIATVGNLVSFTKPGSTLKTFAKINSVSQNSLTIVGVTTVSGICEGNLPTSSINPTDFSILSSSLQSSTDNTLYTKLPKSFVSSVDLTESNLTIRKQFDVTISSNSTGTITADSNETFLPFDEERYALIRRDGTTEPLSPDKFVFTSGSRELTINGLSGNDSAKLIATLRKVNITSKVKTINRVRSIIVDKSKYVGSGVGATTLNNGLTYGNYSYGTRVEDEEICLLYPDVTKLHGIFESNDVSDPDLPSLIFSSLDGPTNKTGDLLIGEKVVGSTSKAVAIYCEKINDLKIGISYLNDSTFIEGESVTFEESGITANVSIVDGGDVNISSNYTLDKSQNNTIYDYSRILRKRDSKEPTRKIKIVFEHAVFLDSDTGDITTSSSYDQFEYCDVGTIDGTRFTDIIDIRQRVSPYTVSAGTRSPFEFLSRSFSSSGNSASNVLASDESFLINYSFYLPRIDRIYLNKDGSLQLSLGEPSEDPKPPFKIQDSLEIATVTLPPYLCNMEDASVTLAEYKRYRMIDIQQLENRIKNLEYYTSLSLLETDTNNLLIQDANGLNRFKSGIFVDNFTTTLSQRKVTGVKNSIDISNSELRPTHFTTEIDLVIGSNSLIGIGTTANPNIDLKYVTDLIGSGIRKTGQIISLNYEEVSEISQTNSTRIQNVNPFTLNYFGGTVELFPSSDVWVQQDRLQANIVEAEGNYVETSIQLEKDGFDLQTGFGPVTWNSWEKTWSGETTTERSKSEEYQRGYEKVVDTIKTEFKLGTKTRTGSREVLKEQFDTTSFGDQVLSTATIPYMRSRNIEFTAKRLKPLTRVYSFFDGAAMSSYTIPKLLEISMQSGVFVVGETVDVLPAQRSGVVKPIAKFRVAIQNHKYGPYNSPTEVFTLNPYNSSNRIPSSYSGTSSILNIDTYSFANIQQGEFFGYIQIGAKLIGRTSGAEATISNNRLITDISGTLIGNLHVTPGPSTVNQIANGYGQKFETGSKVFRLTNSTNNSEIIGATTTSAEETFFAEGKINTVQENIISIRNSRIETQSTSETKDIKKEIGETVVKSKVVGYYPRPSVSYSYSDSGGGGGGGSYRSPYNGVATGYIAATGGYGTVNQNAGGYAPSLGSPLSVPSIGGPAVERALGSGYPPSEVIAWVARTGAAVGPDAAARLGIPATA